MSSTYDLTTVPWLPSLKYLENISNNKHELYELIVMYQTLALVAGLLVVCLLGMVSTMYTAMSLTGDLNSNATSLLIGASMALLVGSVIFAVASWHCLLDLRQAIAKIAQRNVVWVIFV